MALGGGLENYYLFIVYVKVVSSHNVDDTIILLVTLISSFNSTSRSIFTYVLRYFYLCFHS